MKTYIAPLFALFFLVSCFQTVYAQEKKFEVFVGGGLDSPVGPESFSNEFNLGWSAKLAAGYFVAPQLSLGANLSVNRFGFDETKFVTIQNNDISGNDLSVFEFAGVGKYYFRPMSNRMNFYILGGPGIAYSITSDFTFRNIAGELMTTPGHHNTDFMFTTGAGVTHRVSDRWGVFVEGRYSYVFTENDNTSYLPIRAGIVF